MPRMQRGGVEPVDDVDQEPGQMALVEPVGHVHGHQELLVTHPADVVVGHRGSS